MKTKMIVFILILLIGLAGSVYLVRRHQRPAPTSSTRSQRGTNGWQRVDAWQNGIKLAPSKNYDIDAAVNRRLQEILQREEERQKPQEGRN